MMKASSLEVIEESPEEYMDSGLNEESLEQELNKTAASFFDQDLPFGGHPTTLTTYQDNSSKAANPDDDEQIKSLAGRRRQLLSRDSSSILPLDNF